MAHELSMNGARAEMAYVGEVPWHGLGQRLVAGASIEDWRKAAGMDWEIESPMVRYPTSKADVNNPASWRTVDDRVVLIRSDTKDALGIVSDDYQIVQPGEVLEFFRDLTTDAGMVLETAGCLFGGRRFWALAKMGKGDVIRDKRDHVNNYLLLSTSADGTLATEGRKTNIRVVCNNTLSAARGKRAEVRISHRMIFDPDHAKRSLGVSAKTLAADFAASMDVLRKLAAQKMTNLDMQYATLEALGFDVSDMSIKQREAATTPKNYRFHEIMHLADGSGLMGGNYDGASGTAWGWLNAVTQYVDHSARAKSTDRRMNSAWFGSGNDMKGSALEIAGKYAGLELADA